MNCIHLSRGKNWLYSWTALSILCFLDSISTPALSSEVLKLAVTSTIVDSGLSKLLLHDFSKFAGVKVQTIVSGTGQALKYGKAGNVDAVIVHSKAAELDFLKSGHASSRDEIMFNYFVFVGPATDPAKISSANNSRDVMRQISNSKVNFVSRGDNSGTHTKEIELWNAIGFDIKSKKETWYKSTGSGMGATLNIVSAINGYTLVDRGTWLNFKNKGDLIILFQKSSPILRNQYSILIINPDRHPHTNIADADKLKKWLLSARGKAAINRYQVNKIPAFTAKE